MGATHFLVFTKNENGEMGTGVSVEITDEGSTVTILIEPALPYNCTDVILNLTGGGMDPIEESYEQGTTTTAYTFWPYIS